MDNHPTTAMANAVRAAMKTTIEAPAHASRHGCASSASPSSSDHASSGAASVEGGSTVVASLSAAAVGGWSSVLSSSLLEVIVRSPALPRCALVGLQCAPGADRISRGKQFHSSRWDYDYTGGTPRGGLDKLRDKRVAVVGTGSTGVQIVPMVARNAQHLYVVQRTPPIIDSRDNAPIEPGWADRQESGWQRRRMENFDAILAGIAQDTNMVADQWAAIWGRDVELGPTDSPEAITAKFEELDFAQMERVRARVDELVDDPITAEALKPYYSRFCKRPTFNDEYLPTFNRPNVTLINTDGRGLDRITETGIVFDGREYPVDCIVYATGFEFAVATTRSGGFEMYSPGGQALSDHRAEGVRSLHGISVHGFPNMFIIGGLHQAGISINAPLIFGGQARHASQVIKHALDRGATMVEVRSEAQQLWGRGDRREVTVQPRGHAQLHAWGV
jgi:cyclohexanone monooxygenase